ncbi:hypothetical protein GUITHDRAFT_155646 [Guillardia theta CCMP2712]|uniref:Transmembrane protein 230 n=1 Tax=Guillardia theta (strain CCMP2712) TaxID=905079 RepID=L1IFR6_GUITC|nr:hypothetical protein GUITHDRAFT_155646 [Guillardia theta CCMP2712]EKX34749.1 hypothetical protein GUITHDRAFT_155646 [Guillardia theta CCMP2712]|eukprot:XP_005821729.1 hypothetical protein GUITHDRAFT_155646 [Guillardia theta CCMP2712]
MGLGDTWDAEEQEEHTDRARLISQRQGPPTHSIVLAVMLFLVGTGLLIVCILITTGAIDADYFFPGQGWKQPAFTFLALGLVSFVPGFYIARIAFYAWRGEPGFSFSQIPSVRM